MKFAKILTVIFSIASVDPSTLSAMMGNEVDDLVTTLARTQLSEEDEGKTSKESSPRAVIPWTHSPKGGSTLYITPESQFSLKRSKFAAFSFPCLDTELAERMGDLLWASYLWASYQSVRDCRANHCFLSLRLGYRSK